MKWVKHMTSTWDDEKVARLVRGGGVEGLAAYGLWWRVLEIVAGQMDAKSDSCSVTYDVSRWSLLLSLRGSHVRHWLDKLALTTLLTTEWDGSEITVTIPKLLKYRDEYAKKSRQTPSQEVDTEQKENTHTDGAALAADSSVTLKGIGWLGVKKTPEAVCDKIIAMRLDRFSEDARLDSAFMVYVRLLWFDEFFAYYPRKDDKRTARVAYFRAVETLAMKDLVEQAIIDQAPDLLKTEKKFQPLAATWLNKERWNDSRSLLLEEAS